MKKKRPPKEVVYNAKRENWEEVSHREKEVLKDIYASIKDLHFISPFGKYMRAN